MEFQYPGRESNQAPSEYKSGLGFTIKSLNVLISSHVDFVKPVTLFVSLDSFKKVIKVQMPHNETAAALLVQCLDFGLDDQGSIRGMDRVFYSTSRPECL